MVKSERGSITINILMIMCLVGIGLMLYVMTHRSNDVAISGIGVVSPTGQYDNNEPSGMFPDGLGAADTTSQFELDEYGEGIAHIDIFYRDINGDGTLDKITRTRRENGTPHFYYDYTLEINTGDIYTDITPDDLRTIEGAECALQKIQFIFKPTFQIIKISRPWVDSWDTQTMATKYSYGIADNKIVENASVDMKIVCDVADLF